MLPKRAFTEVLSSVTKSAVRPAAFRISSTRSLVLSSTLMVTLADETCTAGASPKKFGKVYKNPTTNAITMIVYFHIG